MTLYLETSALLALTYLGFRLGEAACRRGARRPWVRLAQALVVLSLVLPPLFALVPRPSMPPPLATAGHLLPELYGSLLDGAPEEAPPREARMATSPPRERTVSRVPLPSRRAAAGLVVVTGLLVAGAVLLYRFRALRRLLREATPVRKLGRVTVAVTPAAVVPFSTLVGGRAWVVIPESLLAESACFGVAVRHKLEHHRRGDTRWAIAVELVVASFWANPFARAWKRRIETLQEFSCDESLVGRGRIASHAYGSCLLRVAEAALGRRYQPVGTTGMAAGPGNPQRRKSLLARRVEMLSLYRSPRWRSVRAARGALVVGTLIGVVAASLAYAAKASREDVPVADKAVPGAPALDPAVQKIALRALEAALERHRALAGFALVGEPATGRLLAVANKDVRKWMNPEGPWALSLRVEPASVFKPIIASAAVDKKLTTFADVHDCENGDYQYGGEKYADWKAFDKLTTAETLLHSSNICGIKVAQKLGGARIAEMLHDFGFGPGGVVSDFPGARTGVLPILGPMSEARFVATVGTGVSFSVSPLEILQAMGAIANGGKLMKPLPADASAEAATVVRRVLSEEAARETKQVLADVMVRGTGQQGASKRYVLAGKTGTASSPWFWDHERLGGVANVASFAGFGPVDAPRLVVYVAILDPTDDHPHGATHAAPVFREIADKVLAHWDVPGRRASR